MSLYNNDTKLSKSDFEKTQNLDESHENNQIVISNKQSRARLNIKTATNFHKEKQQLENQVNSLIKTISKPTPKVINMTKSRSDNRLYGGVSAGGARPSRSKSREKESESSHEVRLTNKQPIGPKKVMKLVNAFDHNLANIYNEKEINNQYKEAKAKVIQDNRYKYNESELDFISRNQSEMRQTKNNFRPTSSNNSMPGGSYESKIEDLYNSIHDKSKIDKKINEDLRMQSAEERHRFMSELHNQQQNLNSENQLAL